MATFDSSDNSYTIYRGDCLLISLVYKDDAGALIDLTGKGAIIAFVSETAVPPVEYEIDDNDAPGVTLGGVAGTIEGTIPHNTTKGAAVGKKKGTYQVILTESPDGAGCRTTILSGPVHILESAAELTED